ncbi:MAG: sugar-binding transcriptional regulator [Hyphomicrobiales bacterium]
MDYLRTERNNDEDATLAARAAWLYFAGGKTQGEVADLLNVPNTRAHRLIARASREGLIKVFVDGPIAGCVGLEEELKSRFALSHCEVVPNIDDGPIAVRTLGTAGARSIRNLIERGEHETIGIGHGRTLAAAIELLPNISARHIKFVSLLGGLTRRFAANPFDVIHRLAERTGAEAYLMPVPFFANSVKDKEVLLSQYGIEEVISLARRASLYIAGIGTVEPDSFLASSGMIGRADIAEVRRAGARGEILGQFFTSEGNHLSCSLSDRALAPALDDLKNRTIIALAGGASKAEALHAVLGSGLLSGLITDEASARRLIDERPSRGPAIRTGKPRKPRQTCNPDGGNGNA